MARDLKDYFTRRIGEEEVAAAAAADAVVRQRHAEFADLYRRRVTRSHDDDLDGLLPT